MTPLAYIKLGAFVLVVVALFAVAATVNGWRKDSLELDATIDAMVAMQEMYAAAQKASEGYQSELEDIRNRPVPSTPVRLCPKPRVSGSTSGPSSTLPASGVVQPADGTDPELRGGPDIGPALRSLARRADEVAAQGRATQGLHLKGPR